MIEVTFYQNAEGIIKRCIISGHANYADKGSDIICSAVSMLFINTVNSIEKLANDKFIMNDKKKDTFDFSFVNEPNEKSVLFMDSFQMGLETIRNQYGRKYLKITLKEVQ